MLLTLPTRGRERGLGWVRWDPPQRAPGPAQPLSRPSPCPCPPAPCCPQALWHPAPKATPAAPHRVWTPTAVTGKGKRHPQGQQGGLCAWSEHRVDPPGGSARAHGWQGGDSQHGSTKGKPCLTSLVTTEGPCGQIGEEQLVSCLDVCKALGLPRLGRDEVNGWAVTGTRSWPHGRVHGVTADGSVSSGNQ